MHKIQKILMMIMIGLLAGEIHSNSFTKQKKPSTNMLKESCGQQAGELLKNIPDLMHAMADIQKKTVSFLEDLIDGDAEGFCARATRSDLQNMHQKMVEINKKMKDWEGQMRLFIKEINQVN